MKGCLMKRLLLLFSLLPTLHAADPKLFEYNRKIPFNRKEAGVEDRSGVKVHDISFDNLSGGRTAAYLVPSTKPGPAAAVLFVHWYEPPAKNSNRTQFLDQAVELAKLGTTSLLIET